MHAHCDGKMTSTLTNLHECRLHRYARSLGRQDDANTYKPSASSNTGYLSGTCVAIQEKLQRAVLWSGCRHHIGEVLLSHIFTDLNIEPSKSPDVMFFSRLRSNWVLVAHNRPRQFLSVQPTRTQRHARKLLASMKAKMVERTENSGVCA